MVIFSAFITLTLILFAQFNPLVSVRDNFFINQTSASGEVMGIVEISDRQEKFTNSAQVGNANAPYVSSTTLQAPVKKYTALPVPEITAKSAVVFDANSRKILYEKNPDDIASIASLTKLMTALVVLDQHPDFNKEYVITPEDRREGGRIFLFNGDRVTLNDLFNVSLVGSANTATVAMVHALGMVEADFVSKMNAKAVQMGLRRTTFFDPVGLNPHNTSTAYELVELVSAALAQPKIQQTVLNDHYKLTTKQGSVRMIASTDSLLQGESGYKILGGKTGYIDSAGFCFAGKFRDVNNQHDIISVVLGSSSIQSRFTETDALVTWAYNNYVWP